MARLENMLSRLPSLYRPEDDDTGLAMLFLRVTANILERLNRESGDVMQAHWIDYADKAMFNAFFILNREFQTLPDVNDPLWDEFPYINDLGHLAALLPLSPWQEPATLRELVEAYRARIKSTVELYKNGLGTVSAIRGIVKAHLPLIASAPAQRKDRPFWIEEFAPLVERSLAVPARGEPLEMVGPLFRWTMVNDGIEAAEPTIYIKGVTPRTGVTDATFKPLIELYESENGFVRLGICYNNSQSIEPDKTLRLRPACTSWIGLDDSIKRSDARPTDNDLIDPTAPGPWQPAAGAPSGRVAAIVQTQDKTLWVAANSNGIGALHSYDGLNWTPVLSNQPAMRCIAEDGHRLLIGTETGLMSLALYPAPNVRRGLHFIPGFNNQKVSAIFRASDGRLWVGTNTGAAQLNSDDTLQASALQGVEVSGISQDRMSALYFSTLLGVFQHQPGLNYWYWYEGKEHTEQKADWQQFFPEKQGSDRNFPSSAQVFLPPVNCVHRGPDTSLWFGTENGIARYVARAVRGLTYETVLEAFPDITAGPVFDIKEDARGLVWFCTDRGLFRFDGRDWWQFRANIWVNLGSADFIYSANALPKERSSWRFNRSLSSAMKWERLNSDGQMERYTDAPRTTAEAAIRAVFWTDGVIADLGQWDGMSFTSQSPVNAADLIMRFKPDEKRIVTGGIPAVPRLPAGSSAWRYLSREPEPLVESLINPFWTIEGRLVAIPDIESAPVEGRYDLLTPPPPDFFDSTAFAFNPAAKVWFRWLAKRPLSVLTRLKLENSAESIDPAILDRVWQGIQLARPAGVSTALAVEDQIVRGESNGTIS